MKQTIGSCMLAKALIEISAEEHALSTGPFVLKLTLPDASVVVSDVSKAELSQLGELVVAVQCGETHGRERWDGQSGG